MTGAEQARGAVREVTEAGLYSGMTLGFLPVGRTMETYGAEWHVMTNFAKHHSGCFVKNSCWG